jgi:predicted porin
MKKSLIALAALSAFATAAQAQSSVTVYGSIDAGYASTERDFTDAGTANVGGLTATAKADTKNTGMNASQSPLTSSRIGFRGVEDLGGGLSATFNFETDLATQTGAMFEGAARTSIVGLSDKAMGTLQVGRQLTGLHGVVVGYSAIGGSNLVGDILYSADTRMHSGAAINANFAAVSTTNGDIRGSNQMLTYISPTMNGLTARIDYAKDSRNADAAVAGKEATNDYQGLTLNYAQGPLRVAAATSTVKSKAAHVAAAGGTLINYTLSGPGTTATVNSATGTGTCAANTTTLICTQLTPVVAVIDATNDDSKAKYNAISAAYQLNPALSLQASYAANEFSVEGAKKNEATAYRLGVNYQTGKWMLAAQYGEGKVKTPLADATTAGVSGSGTAADRTAYQMAAIYSLSKRTNLYVAYGTQEQKITSAAASTGAVGGVSVADQRATAVGDSVKSTMMAVGVRHSF